MKEIFDNYLENAFGASKQYKAKIQQFEFNYRKFFPQNRQAHLLDVGIGRTEDSVAWLRNRTDNFDLITLLDVLEYVPKKGIIEFLKALASHNKYQYRSKNPSILCFTQ